MKQETIERIWKFTKDRDWEQFHTPANLAKSISIEAGELLECFQWSETEYDLAHVKEELADVMVYCRNLLDELGLDEDEIINAKMDQNEVKYPVEKARGSASKYTVLQDMAVESAEIELYERETPETAESKKKAYLRHLENLKRYDLTPNEYNMALMLLYFHKSTPQDYLVTALRELLDKDFCQGSIPYQEKRCDIYKKVKKHFTSSINAERRKVGSNDTAEVASYTEEGSASRVLMMFREEPEREMQREIFGETPNLGNVRRVDCMGIACNPGAGYDQFLTDWLEFLR